MTPGEGVPDLIAPGLRVLFVGINPGLRSAELGQHFARPGNRFWKVLAAAGFTDDVLRPDDQAHLVDLGIGITNLVARPSAAAAELTAQDLRDGAVLLEQKVAEVQPAHVAILGVLAFRTAFRRPKALVGAQPEGLAAAHLWVLPNPSGLQARYQLAEMAALYGELARAAGYAAAPRRPDAPPPGARRQTRTGR